MDDGRFPPLLLVAHGSRDPRHAATIGALVGLVEARRPGLPVRLAYLDHCPPSVDDAVAELDHGGHRDLVTVPLLLGNAYHRRVDVPSALRRALAARPRLSAVTADALGPDPLLRAALERRLAEAGVRPGQADAGVVLAGAGTTDVRARADLGNFAAGWARRGWAGVACGHAGGVPTVAEAVAALRARRVAHLALARYFLAPGRLPDKTAADARRAGVDVITEVLGDCGEVAELVLRRYDTAAAARPARGRVA